MIVLVPSFEPDGRLPELVAELRASAPELSVLVVDDGSGSSFAEVFSAAQSAGAEVVGYEGNRGKGHALKVGFSHILRHHAGDAVVSADSDGQHRVSDILRVVAHLDASHDALVLGGRAFAGDVPARSRFGNAVSRATYRFTTGVAVHDTQTGLRGFPPSMLEWLLTVRGERFEYELNVLLGSRAAGITIEEIEIDTVYLQHNASSHFRPIIDSARVFAPMLRYVSSSLAAFALDTIGLILLFTLTQSLIVSVVGARLLSATANFFINRQLVFRAGKRDHLARDALRYLTLALALLGSSYVWLTVLVGWSVPLIAAKLISDVTLYIISFQVQRRFIFRPASHEHDSSGGSHPSPYLRTVEVTSAVPDTVRA